MHSLPRGTTKLRCDLLSNQLLRTVVDYHPEHYARVHACTTADRPDTGQDNNKQEMQPFGPWSVLDHFNLNRYSWSRTGQRRPITVISESRIKKNCSPHLNPWVRASPSELGSGYALPEKKLEQSAWHSTRRFTDYKTRRDSFSGGLLGCQLISAFLAGEPHGHSSMGSLRRSLNRNGLVEVA